MQTIWDSPDLLDELALSSPDDDTEPPATQRGFLFDGTPCQPEAFIQYVEQYDFGSLPPNFVVLHHTYRPGASWASSGAQYDWDAGEAGLNVKAIIAKRQRRLRNIKTYYERVLGWDRGPHLFIDDRFIWLFTPMFHVGIHAAQGNGAVPNYSIGIEVIGSYEHTHWPPAVERNVGLAVAALKQRLGTFELVYNPGPGGVCSHRDFNKPTCPGAAITEEYYLDVLRRGWYELTALVSVPPAPPPPPKVEPIGQQPFQVHPAFKKAWEQSGGVWLPERLTPGYPTGPAEQESDTLIQSFERGIVRQSADGTISWLLRSELREREQREAARRMPAHIPDTLLLSLPHTMFYDLYHSLFKIGLASLPKAQDLMMLADLYETVCERVSLNPVILIAQMLHETANLTSFWSQPPQHNLAGIGVTGEWSPVPKDDWPYNPQRQRYERGVSFTSWDAAVNAHCGRVLAYALPEGAGTAKQQALIVQALTHRPLPRSVRGSATTVFDLAGTWAADEEYGVKMVRKIRGLLAGA